jgi:hypothetical protein
MIQAAVAGDRVLFGEWRARLEAEPDAVAHTRQELQLCAGALLHRARQQSRGEFIPRAREVLARGGMDLAWRVAGDVREAGVTLTLTARRALSSWEDPNGTDVWVTPDGLLAPPDAPADPPVCAETGAGDRRLAGGASDGGLASVEGDLPAHQQAVRPKRSTERGEGREKLIAALTKHHRYADGGCLNTEPINNNELARLAGVDKATASAFFKAKFRGHAKYRAACRDAGRLADALKVLNGEFSPHDLYGDALQTRALVTTSSRRVVLDRWGQVAQHLRVLPISATPGIS